MGIEVTTEVFYGIAFDAMISRGSNAYDSDIIDDKGNYYKRYSQILDEDDDIEDVEDDEISIWKLRKLAHKFGFEVSSNFDTYHDELLNVYVGYKLADGASLNEIRSCMDTFDKVFNKSLIIKIIKIMGAEPIKQGEQTDGRIPSLWGLYNLDA